MRGILWLLVKTSRRRWDRLSRMRLVFRLALVGLGVALSGYSQSELLPYTEVVLKPGMAVTATNPNGTVTIQAGDGTARIFSGEGWKKKRNLIPRRERWYGSLGLYDPASSRSPYGRLLVDEGQLYFSDVSEALKYLYVGSDHFKPVYTNNGLVFGYDVETFGEGEEPTRSVQLWQIYIDGKRPTSMPGADDSSITVSGGEIPEVSTPYPAPVGYVSELGKEEYRPEKHE